jgi:hypothetical protein
MAVRRKRSVRRTIGAGATLGDTTAVGDGFGAAASGDQTNRQADAMTRGRMRRRLKAASPVSLADAGALAPEQPGMHQQTPR